MARKCKTNNKYSGFTYVEMVVAIVVLAIISIGLTQFITVTAEGYIDTGRRNQLSSAGRVVIDRISMELHNALPNSIRITDALVSSDPEVTGNLAYPGDQCIEFVPVRAATTYIDPSFSPSGSTSFDVVKFLPEDLVVDVSNTHVVIYPNNTADIYEAPDSVPPLTRGPREQVGSIGDAVPAVTDVETVTLAAVHRFKRRSRVNRLFLTEEPVSFCITGEKLYRYSNYGFTSPDQLIPENIGGGCTAATCLPSTTPNRVLMTTGLDNAALTDAGGQAFDYLNATRRRNGVVQLVLNFEEAGESVLLNHEALLQGAP